MAHTTDTTNFRKRGKTARAVSDTQDCDTRASRGGDSPRCPQIRLEKTEFNKQFWNFRPFGPVELVEKLNEGRTIAELADQYGTTADLIESSCAKLGINPEAFTADDGQDRYCPECTGVLESTERGKYSEKYCTECGLVTTVDDIDHGKEWRTFRGEGNGSEGGSRGVDRRQELQHDYGLGSEIGYSELSSPQLSRLRTWQKRAKTTKAEKNLAHAFTSIRKIVANLGYSKSIATRAGKIFRTAQSEGVYGVGTCLEKYIGGAVYAGCREMGVPVIPEQIATHLTLSEETVQGDLSVEQAIYRAYKKLCNGLGLEPNLTQPTDYIAFIIDNISDGYTGLEKPAHALAEAAEDHGWYVGRNPRSVAAAAVYVAGQALATRPPTQTEIADTVDISASTLREVKKLMREKNESTVETVATGELDDGNPVKQAASV